MPWCEECSKYWTPNSMNHDGTCPRCGEVLVEPHQHDDEVASAADDERTPWHFKLMVAAVAVYLGWRFIQIFV